MKKFPLQSVAVILGIAIGAVSGGYLTFQRYARDYAMVRYFAWTGISAAVSVNQFDQNSKDAKQELVNTLGFYESGVQSPNISFALKNALRMECGLIEARLSVLENEAGNATRAQTYMSQAQEDLKAVGWIDRSEAIISQAVKRQPVSPCGMASETAAKTNGSTPQKPCG
jgi:hypothetical protein